MFVLLSVEESRREKFFYECGWEIILYSNIFDDDKKDKKDNWSH